jgi:hypothetical protein
MVGAVQEQLSLGAGQPPRTSAAKPERCSWTMPLGLTAIPWPERGPVFAGNSLRLPHQDIECPLELMPG